MTQTGRELIAQAGGVRTIKSLGEGFASKWKEFFGLDAEITHIQRLIYNSDLLCISDEYSFSDEFSIAAPSLFWNQDRMIFITVDHFTGNVLGFMTRVELNRLMGWEALKVRKRKSSKD